MKWSKLFPMKVHWCRQDHKLNQFSLTSTKGKKVRLVGIPLQQSRHAASHSLVALVDEFLAEVVVYLLGRDAVVSRQGAVDELRQLKKEKSDCKSFKIHTRHKKYLVKTW